MTHTPTNWYVFTDGPRPFGAAEISATVGDMPVTVGFASVDDARRIVACVNALKGFSTEAIEAGAVQGLIAAAQAVVNSAMRNEAYDKCVEALAAISQIGEASNGS